MPAQCRLVAATVVSLGLLLTAAGPALGQWGYGGGYFWRPAIYSYSHYGWYSPCPYGLVNYGLPGAYGGYCGPAAGRLQPASDGGGTGGWTPRRDPAGDAENTDPYSSEVDPGLGVMTLRVPPDAVVTINGHATESTGPTRRFYSRGLAPGKEYRYDVEAVFEVEGESRTEKESVVLTWGKRISLALDEKGFRNPTVVARPVETTLKLTVPPDARVMLAGRFTAARGTERVFSTNQLRPGETWPDYDVVVTFEHEGEVVRQEQTVTLAAGETRELTFDVPEDAKDVEPPPSPTPPPEEIEGAGGDGGAEAAPGKEGEPPAVQDDAPAEPADPFTGLD